MELFHGRPENTDGLSEREIKVYDFLDSLEIKYDRVEHEPAMDMNACEEIDRVLGTTMCKNLFLCNRQCTVFYLLMIKNNKPFKTKDLSQQINSSRLSFASSEYMEKLLGITPGAVSILGIINDNECQVKPLIDRELLDDEFVGCHPNINTASIKLKITDIIDIIMPATGHEPVFVDL
jgi:Ala-tRNA(Pro) deacylase